MVNMFQLHKNEIIFILILPSHYSCVTHQKCRFFVTKNRMTLHPAHARLLITGSETIYNLELFPGQSLVLQLCNNF